MVDVTGESGPEDSAEPTVPEPGSSQAEDDRLQQSLASLAGIVMGSVPLESLLERVAEFAVHAVPGADGAGVTLLHIDRPDGRVEAIAASHPFVSEIDVIQYESLNEGPCITAALEKRTVRTGSLGGEAMWPRFGPRVGRLGVHSALSLPLLVPGKVVGAINIYAREKDAFDERSERLGEAFAQPAAVAVHNARLLAQAQELAQQLQMALSTRPIIDQAIGLLRGRTGGSAEDAFARMRTISQREHTKLADVARRIVEDAVRRARARNTDPHS